jgi:hypothetical protein
LKQTAYSSNIIRIPSPLINEQILLRNYNIYQEPPRTTKEPPGTTKMAEGQPLKYTVTHYRKQHHNPEAFIKWIVEEHLPTAMPIFKKHGVLGYSLVSPSYLSESFALPMQLTSHL